MKNKIIYFASILILFASCKKKLTHYELTIQTTGSENINKMFLIKEIGAIVDSTESDNGVFKFSGELKEPQLCAIYSDKYPNKRQIFILDYGKTKVQGEPISLSESEVSFEYGNNNNLRGQFQKQFIEYEDKNLALIIPELRKAQREDDKEQIDFYMAKLDSLALDMRQKIYEFVESNSDCYGMAEVISEELIIRSYLKPEEFLKVYNLYSERIKLSFYGKKLKEYINERNTPPIKIGDQIIDFKMEDVHGNEVSISEFKEKYVLIDFWASWCSPCRADNPNLIKAYKKYNSEGFEIIGISLDTNKEAWLKAIKKDKLSWTNLSDLKGWKNSLATHYKIKGVPTNMLLDKKGKIIELDLHGTKLLDKLNEIFKK